MSKYEKRIKKDKIPLWKYLGLNSNFLISKIDTVFNRSKIKNKNISLRWKILRDKYFASEYINNLSTKRIFEAGFFDDGLSLSYYRSLNYFWHRTPVYKIKNNYKKKHKNKYAILLTTGAFSPIHGGHILFMEAAKKELEANGFDVLGGYFSPSHSDYVRVKDDGLAGSHLSKRMMFCRLTVKSNNWLMIDPWEAECVSCPITYTMVYDRLIKYIKYRFPDLKKIKIFFVVGSDNAAYARAFKKHGYCICVERFGYKSEYDQIRKEFDRNKNVIFVDYKDEHLKCSSTMIRRGDYSMLHEDVVTHFNKKV